MSIVADQQGLYNSPAFPNSIQWSEDNLLAVASGHSVVILDPCDLSGPRMFVGNDLASSSISGCQEGLNEAQDSLHSQLSKVQDASVSGTFKHDAKICSVAWSPAAACSANACLLTTVDTDSKVNIFQPPAHLQNEWVLASDLTGKLLTYMHSTGWKEATAEKPGAVVGAAPLEEPAMIRLRGGGRPRKRPRSPVEERANSNAQASTSAVSTSQPLFKPGDHVEVTNDEAGLRGCWFPAAVQQVERGLVLVAYDEVDDEDTGDALQEWFPAPGAPAYLQALASNFKAHTAPGYLIRPQPPDNVAERGKRRDVGETIDVYLDGGWWEATVKRSSGNDGSVIAQVGLAEHDVSCADIRRRLSWTSGGWSRGRETGIAEDSTPQRKRQKDSASQCTPAASQAGTAQIYRIPEGFSAADLPAVDTSSGARAHGTIVAAFKQRFLDLRKQIENPPSYEKGEQLAEVDQQLLERVKAEFLAVHGKKLKRLRKNPDTAMLAGTRLVQAQILGNVEDEDALGTFAPVYTVPQDFDASVLKPIATDKIGNAKISIAIAFGQRFLDLRQLVPESELPSYKAREHLKGTDAALVERVKAEVLAVYGKKLAGMGITPKHVLMEGRRGIRAVWDPVTGEVVNNGKNLKYQQMKRQLQDTPTPSQEHAATGHEAGGQQAQGRANAGQEWAITVDPNEPYKVPADFDAAACLPGADSTNKKRIIATFPLVFLLRWLALRAEIPEEEQEKYEKGQHLRGRDAEIADQVCAEMMSAFKEPLTGAGLTEKWLMREGKVQIRLNAVRTRLKGALPDAAAAKQAADIAALQQRISAVVQKQAFLEGMPGIPDPFPRPRRVSSAAGAQAPSVPSFTEEYERRLFSISALQVAWSPVCVTGGANAARFSILAVGTKSGRVWLWRYRMPESFSLKEASDLVDHSFSLVGSFVAHAGWVTALAWCAVGDYLVLATGCSEGSVRLYTAAQAALADLPDILPAPTPEDQAPTATEPQTGGDARGASEQISSTATLQTNAATAGGSNGAADGARPPAMQLMAVLVTADLRGVTCIDLRLRSNSSTGASTLCLAAGKAAGMVAVWESGPLAKDSCGAPCASQQRAYSNKAHGSMAVTGVSWARCCPSPLHVPGSSQDGQALLCTTGLDGGVKAWRWQKDQLMEVELPQSLHGTPPSAEAGSIQTQHRTFGVATSGNGLLAAVARESPRPKASDGPEDISRKLWRGCVQLLRLHGPAAPLGPHPAAALSCVPPLVHLGVPFPADRLWDAAAAVSCASSLDAQSSGSSQLKVEAAQAVQGLLSDLERPFSAHAPSSSLSPIPEVAWHGLQLSNAIRRLLHPLPLQGATNSLRNGSSSCLCRPALDTGPEWDAALEHNELALLQRHVLSCLSDSDSLEGSGTGPDGSLQVMLAWVKANAQDLHPELLSICEGASASTHAEENPLRSSELVMTGGPLQSARAAEADIGGCTVSLQRCAASLRLCEGSPPWLCLLCRRTYSSSKAFQHVPTCLYCGVALGPCLPPMFLHWPGSQ